MKKYWIKDPKRRRRYYKKTASREASPLLLRALEVQKYSTALDLGAGAGVDAKEMVRRGIKVTAVDVNSEVEDYYKDFPEIKLVISDFQELTLGKYDLIYTKSAIVFLPDNEFYNLLEKIKKALNKGGVFAARVWGVNDSSNRPERKGKITFTSRESLEKVFEGFEFLYFEETEKDGKTVLGQQRHRHLIKFIARKIW